MTPDSFSDGGRFVDHASAVAHGRILHEQGADLVDVGGESTRPGAAAVDAETEAARVVPVIEALAPHVRVSVDTTKASVATAALRAGATLVNDVSASLAEVAGAHGAGWVAMHMQGTPRTMQHDPRYDDVVAEVEAFLAQRAEVAQAAGVDEVWIDPGIGFGKTADHNWTLLAALGRLCTGTHPVVVGTSRKAFLGAATAVADGRAEPAPALDRLEASVATVVAAVQAGAAMVRVHDVAETVAALAGASGSDPRPLSSTHDRSAGGADPEPQETQRWP